MPKKKTYNEACVIGQCPSPTACKALSDDRGEAACVAELVAMKAGKAEKPGMRTGKKQKPRY